VIVQSIDPRDTEWEVDGPAYRVYFWRQPPSRADGAHDRVVLRSDEFRLVGAIDVAEVFEWARTTAGPEQTFTLYVEHRNGDSPGLIHLMGVDPTVAPS
jgi:hypothetical protein